MHTLHRWEQLTPQGTEKWFCVAYDHGPFCRMCISLAGYPKSTREMILGLLEEIEERDCAIAELEQGVAFDEV